MKNNSTEGNDSKMIEEKINELCEQHLIDLFSRNMLISLIKFPGQLKYQVAAMILNRWTLKTRNDIATGVPTLVHSASNFYQAETVTKMNILPAELSDLEMLEILEKYSIVISKPEKYAVSLVADLTIYNLFVDLAMNHADQLDSAITVKCVYLPENITAIGGSKILLEQVDSLKKICKEREIKIFGKVEEFIEEARGSLVITGEDDSQETKYLTIDLVKKGILVNNIKRIKLNGVEMMDLEYAISFSPASESTVVLVSGGIPIVKSSIVSAFSQFNDPVVHLVDAILKHFKNLL